MIKRYFLEFSMAYNIGFILFTQYNIVTDKYSAHFTKTNRRIICTLITQNKSFILTRSFTILEKLCSSLHVSCSILLALVNANNSPSDNSLTLLFSEI